MAYTRVIGMIGWLVALLLLVTPQGQAASTTNAVVDQTFQKIVDQGFVFAFPALNDVKAQAEQLEADQFGMTINVSVKASPVGREALEVTAKQLGGVSQDATLEVDVGMIALHARAVRISNDPKTIEHFQHRVGSLALVVELILDNGGSYACMTKDYWRLPITAVREVYSFAGKVTIPVLGVSPEFNGKDYGFVMARNDPITFHFRVVMPESDFKRLSKLQGKVMEMKDSVREGECVKAEKNTAKANQ